ncbi:related to ankyrin 3 [Fusarium fujikuroi IMI 58289]|uniref:Related to ankyrin 3 n=1 Tax=Gibberella fujikuroi (strain CBS 195.34 / IMI 58289 / NRRL A-6831) TaxID=1279085 RepID=S0ECB5_GIBF5|nr:related to ankyrin 3 [Fusarium fujikuroi IMI 58289]CCT72581.1 related to ankyrin 3 [Fusarium fujikuroi IMI 58289]SCO22966.1 related to ankyrin 3 [Fusarium fujikuroi]
MSGPSQLHQGGSEFLSTVTGHNVDLGNKSLTRRDTAQTINNHNYYGYSTDPLRDQAHENRGEKRKCTDDQGLFSLLPLGSLRHHESRLNYCRQSEQGSHSHPPLETLLQSLSFKQIDARHENIKKAHRKTCKWIIKRAEYLDWLNPNKVDEHHGFLWIKGKPGAGKSTLMKFLLSNSRRTMKNKIIISFFFNARGEQLEKSTAGMYRSLLLQMLQQLPRLHNVLEPGLVLGISENHDWGVEPLRTLFEQTVEGLGDSSVVAFIDALDECDESEIRSMVSSFKSLGKMSAEEGVSFQVCLASRHYPHITMPKKIELILEGQEGHEQDIISYLDSELEIGESKLAYEIRTQIQEKASGVFMWVVLVSGILQQKFDEGRIHDLKQTLGEIPGDLHELFRNILTRDDANKDEMLLCIQWVLFARNPLKPEQLYFAIRSHIECTTCKWDRDDITEATIRNFILSSSKGLAEVIRTKKDPTVQFIHESVRDFLLKDGGLRVILDMSGDIGAESHDQLKSCCYKYVQSYTEENGSPEGDSKQHLSEACVAADFEFPFLRYAVQNVLYHANAAEEGDISQTEFLKTFQLAEWIQHNNVFQDKDVRRHTAGASLLYLLAEHGFGKLIESHRASQSCFDIEGERYGAPVLAAMATGSRPTVWRLLKRETRDEPTTSNLHTLFHEYNVTRIGKHSIGRNFTFNPKRGLIYYILQNDDLIVASFVIASRNAYTWPELQAPRSETLFSVAIQHCHDVLATFRFLLENGADIEARDKRKGTPLALAAANGNAAVVAFLMGKGANVDHTCNHDMTALMYAAAGGSEECMRLLISGGASVAATDNQGQTALFGAVCSENESEAKVHLLIGHGVDVAATDNNGCTALAWSLKAGKAKESTVQMLLGHSDIVDKPDHVGRTPLMFALNSNLSIMKQLIEWGAHVNSIDNQGQSALLLAVKLKAESHARLLIDSGACTDVYDTQSHRTALSYAVTWKYSDIAVAPRGHSPMELFYHGDKLPPSIAEALLIRGAAVGIPDLSGRTPLSYTASTRDGADLTALLLSYGADVDRADNNGRTPLSYAAKHNSQVCELLLSYGADVDRADNNGRTPLSYAAQFHNNFSSWYCVQLLLDRGASPDKVDEAGKTALSYIRDQQIEDLLSN